MKKPFYSALTSESSITIFVFALYSRSVWFLFLMVVCVPLNPLHTSTTLERGVKTSLLQQKKDHQYNILSTTQSNSKAIYKYTTINLIYLHLSTMSSPSQVMERLFNKWQQFKAPYARRWQHILDTSLPQWKTRWLVAGILLFCYIFRVYLLQGFHMISYALAIYLLNRLLDFISPLEDPESVVAGDELPIAAQVVDNEYKPFIRKIPEFKFW
jgi:hypothetical protein